MTLSRIAATVGKGQIAGAPAGEYHFTYRARSYQPDATRVPVVYCHHALGTAATPFRPAAATTTDQELAGIVEALCELGHPVISSDQNGASSWSNDVATTAVGGALARVAADLGCRNDRVLLLADSMGTLLALNWARQNAVKVAGMALLLPIPDLAYVHANGPAPIPANIETAFGGSAAYQAAAGAHDPMQHTAELAGVPIKLWYSTDDPTAVPERALAFAAALGLDTVSMGAVGHTIPQSVDPGTVAAWLHARA